jgi:DNA-binding beta-propeller fold protein YncE
MNRRAFLAGVVALAAAPEALARTAGGTPATLVTADAESHVAVVAMDGRLLRRIPTLEGPRSIEAVLASDAVVAHTTEGAISILDGAELRVRRVLHGFGEPRYTAVGAGGRYAYVTDSARGEVAVVDLRGRVAHRTAVDGPARHVAFEPASRMLWTALGSKAGRIAVLDASDPWRPRRVTTIRPPFLAHDVAFAPDGRRVWVTSGDRGRIAVYDARSRRPLFLLPAGAPPQHVSFGPGVAYVTSGDDGTLRVHALADGRVLRTTRIPVGSYNVTRGRRRVLTPSLSEGTLCVLDAQGRLLERVDVARAAHDAAFVVTA